MAYHVETQGRFDPPLAGLAETHTVQDAKWTGPCPADMRPGDMVTTSPGRKGGEVRMNLRNLLRP